MTEGSGQGERLGAARGRRTVVRLCSLAVVLGAVCWAHLLAAPAPAPAEPPIEVRPDWIRPDEGFAYVIPVQRLGIDIPSDRKQEREGLEQKQSPLILREDGVELTPHALHATIREQGHGCFSHWGQQIDFAATDNTDPRVNGRHYEVLTGPVLEPEPTQADLLARVGLAGAGMLALAATLVWFSSRPAPVRPPSPAGLVTSLVVALALLVLPELGLRWMEARAVPEGGLPVGRTLDLVIGSSRTMRSLMPEVIEAQLGPAGDGRPWVANVSRQGSTMVGIYQRYRDEVHPRLSLGVRPGTLAIEVRGSGLNDNYLADEEATYADQQADVVSAGLAAGSGSLPALLDLPALAHWLAANLRLFSAQRIVGNWRGSAGRKGEPPPWAEGDRGWRAFATPREGPLAASKWEAHYRNRLLADYALGGVQTAFLRQLIRDAREDGWKPVLYVLPITDIQSGFYPPGARARFLEHLARVADEEDAALFDFDTGNTLGHDAFYDTHHLNREAARAFSVRFGREVFGGR